MQEMISTSNFQFHIIKCKSCNNIIPLNKTCKNTISQQEQQQQHHIVVKLNNHANKIFKNYVQSP